MLPLNIFNKHQSFRLQQEKNGLRVVYFEEKCTPRSAFFLIFHCEAFDNPNSCCNRDTQLEVNPLHPRLSRTESHNFYKKARAGFLLDVRPKTHKPSFTPSKLLKNTIPFLLRAIEIVFIPLDPVERFSILRNRGIERGLPKIQPSFIQDK